MSGSLIQLVAKGIHDNYLISEPEITFFKIVYRRHTNFAVESIRQNFLSDPKFGKSISCDISNSGDMVYKIFIYIEIPSIPKFSDNINKFAWVKNLGYAMIKDISIEIGGKVIDRQYGEWLYIWSELNNTKQIGLNKMIGNIPDIYEFSNGKKSYGMYVPLEFWFCKNIGSSIPIVSLNKSSIKLNITFQEFQKCCRTGPTHYIELLDPISSINNYDYIEFNIDGVLNKGYVIGFDFLSKRLYYIDLLMDTNYKYEKHNNDIFYTNDTNTFNPAPVNPVFDKNFDKLINTDTIQQTIYTITNPVNGITTKAKNNPIKINNENILDSDLSFKSYIYVDYIYLDKVEREKIMNTNSDNLIEQI